MFRLVFGLNLNVIGITWNDIDIELCSVHVDISNDKGTWYDKQMHVLLFKSSKYKKSRIIFFFICKNYSDARYIMFDKLDALVELSLVDTHTLQEQLCHDTTGKMFITL